MFSQQDISKIISEWNGKTLETDHDRQSLEYLEEFLDGAGYDYSITKQNKVYIFKKKQYEPNFQKEESSHRE